MTPTERSCLIGCNVNSLYAGYISTAEPVNGAMSSFLPIHISSVSRALRRGSLIVKAKGVAGVVGGVEDS